MLGAACVVCWWPLSRPAVDEYDRHLAFAYVQDGRPDAALPLYRNLLILHQQPTDELLYAYALGRAGQMPDALAILGRLAGDDRPVEIRHRAYAYRGDLAREQKEWPIAIAAYRKAIEVDQSDSAAWNSLAVCWIATGQLDEAEDALGQALRLTPEYLLAQENLRMLHARRSAIGPTSSIPAPPSSPADPQHVR